MLILSEYDPDELSGQLNTCLGGSQPLPAYRGRQIFSRLSGGVKSFSEMTNLPGELRRTLEERAVLFSSSVEKDLLDPDGTRKLKLKLQDGLFIESVLLKDQTGRLTACLSSQAGCAMGCRFCKTGSMGLLRHLSAGEIAEQFYHLSAQDGRIGNVVFMGMGEPLDNIEAVLKAVNLLSHKEGKNISPGKMTISTCGLVPGIQKLADAPPALRLAVSLNSARQEIRETIMPIAKMYPLEELQACLKNYQEKKGKRITLEYVLLEGINDSREDVKALINFTRPLKTIVNIIPWNSFDTGPYKSPGAAKVREFCAALEEKGVAAVRRTSRGRRINGACGQLAGQNDGE